MTSGSFGDPNILVSFIRGVVEAYMYHQKAASGVGRELAVGVSSGFSSTIIGITEITEYGQQTHDEEGNKNDQARHTF